jgi:replicative DNA helicase
MSAQGGRSARPLAVVRDDPTDHAKLRLLHTQDVEPKCVAGFVIDPSLLAKESRPLPRHFDDRGLGIIFARACELYDSGQSDLTVPRLALALDQHAELDRVGGAQVLAEILAATPTAAHLAEHAREVRALALERKLRRTLERASTWEGPREGFDELLLHLRKLIDLRLEGRP